MELSRSERSRLAAVSQSRRHAAHPLVGEAVRVADIATEPVGLDETEPAQIAEPRADDMRRQPAIRGQLLGGVAPRVVRGLAVECRERQQHTLGAWAHLETFYEQ